MRKVIQMLHAPPHSADGKPQAGTIADTVTVVSSLLERSKDPAHVLRVDSLALSGYSGWNLWNKAKQKHQMANNF